MGHEEELVKAFFAPTKRERYLEMLTKPKNRQKFLRELAHFKSLDRRYCVPILPGEQHPEQIASIGVRWILERRN